MIKNILIPTDFTIESLNILKIVLSNLDENGRYNIILIHGVETTDSITEFLFFSKSKLIESISNEDFSEACEILKNKYSNIVNALRKDVFTGFTQNAFNNYLEANKVDEIFIPENYSMRMASGKSFDILPFIEKCNLDTTLVSFNTKGSIPEKGNVAEIFYNGVAAR